MPYKHDQCVRLCVCVYVCYLCVLVRVDGRAYLNSSTGALSILETKSVFALPGCLRHFKAIFKQIYCH